MMLLVISGSNSVLDKRQRFSETCKMFLYIYTHAKWLRLPVRQAFFFLEKHVLCVPRNTFPCNIFVLPCNALFALHRNTFVPWRERKNGGNAKMAHKKLSPVRDP